MQVAQLRRTCCRDLTSFAKSSLGAAFGESPVVASRMHASYKLAGNHKEKGQHQVTRVHLLCLPIKHVSADVADLQANDKVMPKSLLCLCGHAFPHVNADSKKSLLSHASATIPMERLTSPSWSCYTKTRVNTETQWNATDGKACFPAPRGVCRNMKTNGTPSMR